MKLRTKWKFLKMIKTMTCNSAESNNVGSEIISECKEYLDQFTDTSKKVDESDKIEHIWKPEVGKLYKRDCGTVYEYKGIKGKYALFSALDGSKAKVYPPDNIPLIPIAELEGLKQGERVWSLSDDGEPIAFEIFLVGTEVIWASLGDIKVAIKLDGALWQIGNCRQVFWRTADRAERFGRGDE